METNYVTILDFTTGWVNIIHLTPEEIQESEKHEDFESFLSTLEEKYGFKISNCQWMVSEELHIARYENGEEVQTEDI